MHTKVPIEQVKSTLERWIQVASRGEVVLITRDGQPVAALVSPPPPSPTAESPAALDPELVSLLGWEDSEQILRFLGE